MAEVVVINANALDPFVKLREALDDTTDVMERIGAILEASTDEAFDDQKFGDFVWPEQYPNQADPFVNLAGLISDFADGATEPKARRLTRKPALIDTGALSKSFKSRVLSNRLVEIGSTHPAAATHQWGLVSSQSLAQDTKNRIAKWVLKQDKDMKKKIAPLLMPSVTGWDTQVAQRPMIGVTREAEVDIVEAVESMIAEKARGHERN